MSRVFQDVRYALRLLSRDRGFTVVAILTLALGIGVTTAIFTVVNAVLLRPLPYADPERLVIVRADGAGGMSEPLLAGDEIDDLRQFAGAFAQVEGITSVNGNVGSPSGAEPMERVPAASTSQNFLAMLGVKPAIGRLPGAGVGAGEGHAVTVLISHELWQRRFAGDPAIVGRLIEVNNMRAAVGGVLPRGFRIFVGRDANIPARMDIWFSGTVDAGRGNRAFTTIARLRPGATVESARAEVDVLAGRLSTEHPQAYSKAPLRMYVEPLQADTVRAARPALLALMGAVMFVLLIACANLANLLLARTAARSRELAVRAAVGAGRSRIVRQLLTEGLVIGALGGAAGLLVAPWSEAVLLWLRPSSLSAFESLPLDWRVIAFAIASTMSCSVLFSLVPAIRGTRVDLQGTLKAGSRSSASSGGSLRHALVVAEVALAIVLLCGAGLMLRTVAALQSVPTGFEAGQVLTMQATMQPRAFREYDKRWQFYRTALERIRFMPGVESVSAVRPLPLEPMKITEHVAAGDIELVVEAATTLPGYFQTMKIAMTAGRDFTDDDMTYSRPVVVVDEQFARTAWPGRSPEGQTLRVRVGAKDVAPLTVVGVVGHVHAASLRDAGRAQVYLPYHAYPLFDMAVVVRTAGDPLALAAPARQAIESLGGLRPVHEVRLMNAYLADALAESRFALALLGLFAGLALFLSAIGLYGVVSYSTAQRTREIGVRVALGAARRDILRLVVGDGIRWTAAGIVLGLAASAALTRYLAALLFDVEPTDPATMVGVAALLTTAACLACYVPARRAARVNPAVALRGE